MNWEQIAIELHRLTPLSIFLRLGLATLFGAILGIDRARKQRPAGFRTHMLVCMGSALVMITNQFLQLEYLTGDPARLGAQVISGIGFLGAGTIIVTHRSQVMGLTTAAGLWVSACLGLAIGAGFYTAAIMGAVYLLFIVVVMQGIDERLQRNSRHLIIYAEFLLPAHLSAMLSFAAQNGMTINEVEIIESRNQHESIGAVIQIRLPDRFDHQVIIQKLAQIDGVSYVTKV